MTETRKRGFWVAAVLAVLGLMGSPAYASTLTFDLTNVFSGSTPDSTSPYATAIFRDGADCLVSGPCAAGTVQLTITSSLEDSSEFFSEFFFNTTTTIASSTVVGSTGTFTNPTFSINPPLQADGDGIYDFKFLFVEAEAQRFNGTDQVVIALTGTGLDVSDFNILSEPSGGAGPFHVAAHLQGISPTCSGWVSDLVGSGGGGTGPCVPAPEPSTLLLLGSGLAGLGLWGRKKFMNR